MINKKKDITIQITGEIGTSLNLSDEQVDRLVAENVADVLANIEMNLNRDGRLRWHLNEAKRIK